MSVSCLLDCSLVWLVWSVPHIWEIKTVSPMFVIGRVSMCAKKRVKMVGFAASAFIGGLR